MITTAFTPADPGRPSLAAGQVHLWRAQLSASAPGVEVLEAAELSRIGRLIDSEKRTRRLNCRRILRALLGAYLEMPPAEIRLRTGQHGRPHLDSRFHLTDLNFNLSHAGPLAVIALARTPRLGIDIEPVRELRCREALLRRCFSHAERRRLQAHPPDEHERLFFRAWTAKEAVLKAGGAGIFHAPAAVEVGWRPSLHMERIHGSSERAAGWKLWEFVPDAGIHGTVALPAERWSVRCMDIR